MVTEDSFTSSEISPSFSLLFLKIFNTLHGPWTKCQRLCRHFLNGNAISYRILPKEVAIHGWVPPAVKPLHHLMLTKIYDVMRSHRVQNSYVATWSDSLFIGIHVPVTHHVIKTSQRHFDVMMALWLHGVSARPKKRQLSGTFIGSHVTSSLFLVIHLVTGFEELFWSLFGGEWFQLAWATLHTVVLAPHTTTDVILLNQNGANAWKTKVDGRQCEFDLEITIRIRCHLESLCKVTIRAANSIPLTILKWPPKYNCGLGYSLFLKTELKQIVKVVWQPGKEEIIWEGCSAHYLPAILQPCPSSSEMAAFIVPPVSIHWSYTNTRLPAKHNEPG